MAERVESPLVHAESVQTLAVCLASEGRSVEAIDRMEEAFRLAKEVGDFSNLMRCYNNLPSIVADLGSDHRRADKVLREGLELAQRAGSLTHMGWLAGSVGDIGFRLGNLEESEALQREALELAKAVGDEPLRGMRLIALASAVLFRGRLEEAEAIFRESVPILNENPEPQSQIFIPQFEGHLALARGENDAAAVSFEAMIEQLRVFNVEVAPDVFPDLVRALHRAGRGPEGRDYHDLSEHGRSPAATANAVLVEGMLAEDPAEARRLLAEGTAALADLGLRIEAARAMGDLARAMTRVGEDPRQVLDRARNILLACDARAFLFEVEEGYGR
jgi:tetratricopeptide (TPR) repeat protein